MRPLPTRFYDPERVKAEYGEHAPKEADPYDPAKDWEKCFHSLRIRVRLAIIELRKASDGAVWRVADDLEAYLDPVSADRLQAGRLVDPSPSKSALIGARNGVRDAIVKLRGGHSTVNDDADHALAALDIAIGMVGLTTTTPLTKPHAACVDPSPPQKIHEELESQMVTTQAESEIVLTRQRVELAIRAAVARMPRYFGTYIDPGDFVDDALLYALDEALAADAVLQAEDALLREVCSLKASCSLLMNAAQASCAPKATRSTAKIATGDR